jgi:hypothetical protein
MIPTVVKLKFTLVIVVLSESQLKKCIDALVAKEVVSTL